MAFAEVRIEDGLVIYGTDGGPEYNTMVATVASGDESRNSLWSNSLNKYDWGDRKMTDVELSSIVGFFRAREGKLNGFRLKDWGDFAATAALTVYKNSSAQGVLAAGIGNGTPTYNVYKNYVSGVTVQRRIFKLVAGTFAPQRAGVALVAGAGAGQYAVDVNTGIMTMVADASSNASAIAVGATTSVSLAANPGGLVAGKLLYLTGFTGADAALVNGIAHVINSVGGAGPFVFVLATNTAGKAITLGAGAGAKYPQASETMTATYEFDVPVRFDADQIQYRFDSALVATQGTSAVPAILGIKAFYVKHIPIVELRNP